MSEEIQECNWCVSSNDWNVCVVGFTNEDPEDIARYVTDLVYNKKADKLIEYFKINNLSGEFDEFVTVTNNVSDNTLKALSSEIINQIKT